ncbi:GmrSD restriction endonuclease domain-containing protein [Volucribacter amazonae]|uniref:DUF262 domain-containing protein n=1 Tax=Volucribacter amazonae TaxID=256731 RepID=A0A9X4P9G5_9PAST|nr:DUF262 domain-containing protein [Volucribacter amazonae]MDG6894202.1 hypothetical protein [Volucribacter amazonae]
MKNTKIKVKTIQQILKNKNISIPNYQYDYLWEDDYVNQLLIDLLFHFKKKTTYQLGTVIIHRNKKNNTLNIIDGYQRLIILAILFYGLDNNTELGKSLLALKREIFNDKNHQKIINHYNLIKSFIDQQFDHEQLKYEFIDHIKKYTISYIETTNLSQAIKILKSQNTTNKIIANNGLLELHYSTKTIDNKQNISPHKAYSLTINQLINKKYIIPLSQHHYDWQKSEIEQLLNDLNNAYKKGEEFYFATLLLNKKQDNCYEVIDGQYYLIILKLLIIFCLCWNKKDKRALEFNFELSFPYQQEYNNIFTKLSNESFLSSKSIDEIKEKNTHYLQNLYDIIKNYLYYSDISSNIKGIEEDYIKFIFNKVNLFHMELASHIDIKHYFNIINQQTKQLTVQQVIKSKFISKLNKTQKESFCHIWDYCANMDSYLLQEIEPNNDAFLNALNNILFGKENINQGYLEYSGKEILTHKIITKDNYHYPISNDQQDNKRQKYQLIFDLVEKEKINQRDLQGCGKDILTNQAMIENNGNNLTINHKNNNLHKYQSIIDFPQFLMLALEIFKEKNNNTSKDIDLNTAEIMERFDNYFLLYFDGQAMDFIIHLFKLRMIFDNYIIKIDHSNNKNFVLYHYNSNKNLLTNTFDNQEENKHITMLLSVLYLSCKNDGIQERKDTNFLEDNYIHWLYKIVSHIYNRDNHSITAQQYIIQLQELAHNEFKNRKNFYRGKDIPQFLFFYLDYLLWLDYKTEKEYFKNIEDKVKKYIDIDNFSFTDNNYIIEYYEINGQYLDEVFTRDCKDYFGNLFLIPQQQYYCLHNKTWQEKRNQYDITEKMKLNCLSIKQAIMFSYENWTLYESADHLIKMRKFMFKNEEYNCCWPSINVIGIGEMGIEVVNNLIRNQSSILVEGADTKINFHAIGTDSKRLEKSLAKTIKIDEIVVKGVSKGVNTEQNIALALQAHQAMNEANENISLIDYISIVITSIDCDITKAILPMFAFSPITVLVPPLSFNQDHEYYQHIDDFANNYEIEVLHVIPTEKLALIPHNKIYNDTFSQNMAAINEIIQQILTAYSAPQISPNIPYGALWHDHYYDPREGYAMVGYSDIINNVEGAIGKAFQQAITSPLLQDIDPASVKLITVHISAGTYFSYEEYIEIQNILYKRIEQYSNQEDLPCFITTSLQPNLAEKIQVIVMLRGFNISNNLLLD